MTHDFKTQRAETFETFALRVAQGDVVQYDRMLGLPMRTFVKLSEEYLGSILHRQRQRRRAEQNAKRR